MRRDESQAEGAGGARTFFGRGLHWPAMVAIVFLGNIGLAAWVIVASSSDPSFAVESDYYEKAINWNDEIDQRERNAALGWSVSVEGTPRLSEAGWCDVTLAVRDRDGSPIDGAVVTLLALPIARAHETFQLTLDPTGPGTYAGRINEARYGRWQLRVRVEHEGDVFTERLEAMIERAG